MESDVSLPSTTIVLGPFGDVVDYGDGSCMCPRYRRAAAHLLTSSWLHGSRPPEGSVATIRSGIRAGLASVVPGSLKSQEDLEAAQLLGGAIFAWVQ